MMPLPPSLVAVQFDTTISLGAVLSAAGLIVTILVLYHKAVQSFDGLKAGIHAHAELLDKQDQRMERYEGRYLDLSSALQKIVGRIEAEDRRAAWRPGRERA